MTIPTKALLIKIIKRKKKADKKMNVLANMLAENGSYMPHGVFTNDEEDFE